jgi:uroporphyrinogen decarboxylase
VVGLLEAKGRISKVRLSRRDLFLALSAAAYAGVGLDSKKRIDRTLVGKDVDRPPFSAWHHFHLESEPPEVFAKATIEFHQQTGTDLVKVMSDFPYPKPAGGLDRLQVEPSPFPAQLRALELIRDGIGNENYFVETIFNPWSVAEKLSSREYLLDLKSNAPQKLFDILEVITQSEINHARAAIQVGARGIFLAIQNAVPEVLGEDDYAKFSEPFDKLILSSVSSAPLNILHLHGNHVYWQRFTSGWAANGINYSVAGTKVPISEVRRQTSGVILGGIDGNNFSNLTLADLRLQAKTAREEGRKQFLLTPGCSVPDDTSAASVRRLRTVF